MLGKTRKDPPDYSTRRGILNEIDKYANRKQARAREIQEINKELPGDDIINKTKRAYRIATQAPYQSAPDLLFVRSDINQLVRLMERLLTVIRTIQGKKSGNKTLTQQQQKVKPVLTHNKKALQTVVDTLSKKESDVLRDARIRSEALKIWSSIKKQPPDVLRALVTLGNHEILSPTPNSSKPPIQFKPDVLATFIDGKIGRRATRS